MNRPDLVIVGAGLSGGLLACRLAALRPQVKLLVLEAGERPGGAHTWSFHAGDVDARQREWLAPFVASSWPGYEVRFPARRRRIETGYATAPSGRFAKIVERALGARLVAGAPVARLMPGAVEMADGARIEAGAVIDARGPRETPHLRLGFQKFLGQEVEFERPHGLGRPVVMDATVSQTEGYRFVYCLPFSPTRMLIEDTYYADGAALDRQTLRGHVAAYAKAAGWGGFQVVREEDGVLPIALGGDIEAHLASLAGVPTIGLAAALFHPTTGYSLPDAVRTADLVAGLPDLSPRALNEALTRHARGLWRERAYFRVLNRLLFLAGEPSERYRILQHFHRLPAPLIARFYAGRLTAFDKARILIGKPPVSVRGALAVLSKGSS
ncbi:lycopene beta-cyclase CrtY [Aureimonas populi]|uniref:Lycopene beta-cyclase CrtY n=1 Tax=Aureimonas populi TaxID=1701758 RepID=A0ABW5CPV5_9HYPH|nr:lycopene beta-cyclase CrtY [Aureimonas populi]